MQKLLIATTNDGKLKEIKHFLADLPFEIVGLGDLDKKIEEPEETENTLEGNAILKAKYYAEKTGLLTIADDSGLFVDYLDGWPGVKTARVADKDEDKRAILLRELKDVSKEKRNAEFRVSLALFDPKENSSFIVSRKLQGSIVENPIFEGDIKWGFNELFFVSELGKTYGQMTIPEKNAVSHRGKALIKAKYFLQNQYGTKHIVVPIALVIKDGKILMNKRNDPHRPEYHGKWEFPGGSMEFGETFEQNVIRETKEEAGFDVEVVKMLNRIAVENQEYPSFKYQVYLIPFVCKIVGGDGKYGDAEVLESKWFALDDALNYEMIGENAKIYKEMLPELKNLL